MNIPQKVRIIGLALAIPATVALASTMIVSRGLWPETWPKELEALRSKATTLRVHMGSEENVYEIPFESREEFEAAWPHILSLRSKGSPISLQPGPVRYSSLPPTVKAGVLILGPSDSPQLRKEPPWPESIKFPSG